MLCCEQSFCRSAIVPSSKEQIDSHLLFQKIQNSDFSNFERSAELSHALAFYSKPSCTCWFSKFFLGNNFCLGYSAKFTQASVLEQMSHKICPSALFWRSPGGWILTHGCSSAKWSLISEQDGLPINFDLVRIFSKWLSLLSQHFVILPGSKWQSWILFFKVKVWFSNPVIKLKEDKTQFSGPVEKYTYFCHCN